MTFNRELVRAAAFVTPLVMFAAIPLLGIARSPYFGSYLTAYIAISAALAWLKWKVDGTLRW